MGRSCLGPWARFFVFLSPDCECVTAKRTSTGIPCAFHNGFLHPDTTFLQAACIDLLFGLKGTALGEKEGQKEDIGSCAHDQKPSVKSVCETGHNRESGLGEELFPRKRPFSRSLKSNSNDLPDSVKIFVPSCHKKKWCTRRTKSQILSLVSFFGRLDSPHAGTRRADSAHAP